MLDPNLMSEYDVAELCVRVSRYEQDGVTPASWQAIAKRRVAMGGPWGVGVRRTPDAAIKAAFEELERLTTPTPISKYGF